MKNNRSYILKNNISFYRKKHELSQSDLGKLCGVSRNTISSLETGFFTPSAYLSGILCHFLDCKWEQLFYFVDKKGKIISL